MQENGNIGTVRTTLTVGDLVIHCGKIVGRIVYFTDTNWAGVKDSSGHIDEYYLDNLSLAE